jgi:hypothetical protein
MAAGLIYEEGFPVTSWVLYLMLGAHIAFVAPNTVSVELTIVMEVMLSILTLTIYVLTFLSLLVACKRITYLLTYLLTMY